MTAAVGKRYIPQPDRKNVLVKKGHNTGDIVREVLDTYKASKQQLADFAKRLAGTSSQYDTCKKIFDFVKQNIRYQEDPPGKQWVKTPARLFADKVGDCKSFSIFCASCLHNAGIPGVFRFVSFTNSDIPTHVYVVALVNGREVKIDPVIDGFDTQKPFTHKIDYDMNALYRMSGVGAAAPAVDVDYNPKPGAFKIPVFADGTTNDKLIEAAIAKQRMEIESAMMARVAGIGSTAVEINQQLIRDIDAQIKQTLATDGTVGKTFFGKIFAGVKRVVTAPMRLVAEVAIPKAAMGFVYGFVNDTAVCSKLPAIVCKKAEKQRKLAKTVCSIISMKEPHFWGLVENGVMKRTGKKPWVYLAELMGMNVYTGKMSGIGAIPLLATMALQSAAGAAGSQGAAKGMLAGILQPVIELVKSIISLFKKNPGTVEDAVPDPSDFDGWQPDRETQQQIQEQVDSTAKSTLEKVLERAEVLIPAATQALQSAQNVFAASQATGTYAEAPAPGYEDFAYQPQQPAMPAANTAEPAAAASSSMDMKAMLPLLAVGVGALFLLRKK